MKKELISITAAFFCLLTLAGTGKASERDLPKELYITDARDIVLAKVLEQHCTMIGDAGPYTIVTLQVIERFKGNQEEKKLVLILPGGTIGNSGIDVGGIQDEFVTGTEVIVHTKMWSDGYLITLRSPLLVFDGLITKYKMNLSQFRELVKSVLSQ